MTHISVLATLARPMLFAETPIHRLSVEDVRRMVEAGVLLEEDRVELIDGVLIDMSPPGAEHSSLVAWLNRHFAAVAGEREVRVQDLLLVEGGFVMPDLMVIDPLPRDRQPDTAVLVVEVSLTTQRHDASKAIRYARADVSEYWTIDIPARTVHVHRVPAPAGYGELTTYGDGMRITSGSVATTVDVSEMLG